MALSFAHGAVQWLSADAATTTYAVSGLGFVPKALRFYWMGLQNAGDAASQTVHARSGVGFALTATNRLCVGGLSQDAVGTEVCAAAYRNDAIAVTATTGPAVDGLLDLQSIDSDGFTLVVDDAAPANVTVFWEAWGGADIIEAYIGEIAEPAATGNQDYATSCSPPSVVMFAGGQGSAAANTVTRQDWSLMVGAATGPNDADNVVAVANDDDASTTSDTDSYCKTGECLASIVIGGGNATARAKMTTWLPNGFRLNWIARATTNRRYIYLSMQGGIWQAGAYTIAGNSGSATATATTAPRGIPFQPVGLSFLGCMTVQNSAGTSNTQGRIGLGSATGTSSRRSQGVWAGDALGTASEIRTTVNYSSCLSYPSSTGTLAAAYDIDAILSDGFRVIVDTAGGVASEWQGYVACGSYPLGPTTFNNYLGVKTGDGVSNVERIR